MHLINLIDFCKYPLILNLVPAAGFKQVEAGVTKDCGMLQKQ